MAEPRPTQPLQIGDYVFDPALNELRRGDQGQRLPLRLADLLLRLAAEPGRVVRRETLIEEVWDRRQVNDEVLSRAIADLRLAFGDDARAPRVIETLPKLGYRLVAPVTPIAADELHAGTASRVVPATLSSAPTAAAAKIAPGARRRLPLALGAAAALLLLVWTLQRLTVPSLAPSSTALTAQRLTQARPFLVAPGRELFPRFTPDGRWVVYTRAGPLASPQPAQLWLRAVDGTADRVLVEDALDNWCGSVSPDGTTLAWLRQRPGTCEVMHRPLLGGPPRVLAGCGGGTLGGCPEWTPDGRALLLGAGATGAAGLREIEFPSGSERSLTQPHAGQRDLMPRIDPAGATIVFWRGDGGGRSLQRVARDGRPLAPLRTTPFLGFGHAFEPGGALVAADDSFGQRSLVRFAPDAPPELLGAHDARHPDLARDGSLVYEVAHFDANLWLIALDDAALVPRQLTESPRYDSQPAHSPDGIWLAFGSNRDGREGVYVMRADGRDERKLPLDPALRWTSPMWSPDGKALLVLRYDAQGARLCRHVLDGARTDCPDALAGERHGAFFLSPDVIGMVDAHGATPQLWQLSFDGSAPQPVDTAGPVDRCRATARWLVCHRPGQAGLWLRDRQSGQARDLLPELPSGARGWALVGDVLYVPLADATPPGLYRHDLRDGSTRHVASLLPTAIGDALSVAPDERSAVVARTDALEVDLMYLPAVEGAR